MIWSFFLERQSFFLSLAFVFFILSSFHKSVINKHRKYKGRRCRELSKLTITARVLCSCVPFGYFNFILHEEIKEEIYSELFNAMITRMEG